MKGKLVFFGAGQYVIPIIEALDNKFELSLVVTTERDGPVVSYCKENKIEILSVSSLSSEIVTGQLSMVNCQIAVLASFGLIVPDKVLNMFDLGIINIHPSLLPKYRGTTPVQTAILNGDETTGVSIIKLDSEIDHGPVLGMIDHTILSRNTADSLYRTLFQKGADLLLQVLSKYIAGELKPVEQDHSQATFTEHLTRDSGFININQPPTPNPQVLDRMIRAYHPWPGVWFRYECHPEQREGSLLNGKIIKLFPEGRIQVEGKNIMQLKDFANGYPEARMILEKLSLSNYD